MNRKNEFKGYWYLYIHSKLRERTVYNELPITEAKSFLFEWRVPKQLRIVVLKEMEELGLIEILNRNTIKINKSNFDFDNINKIYEEIGLVNLSC